mgnify:CR=1 FL=1
MYKRQTERIKATLRQCEEVGINTFCGRADNHIMRLLNEYWNEGGRIQWLAQTAPERRSLEENIRQAARAGARAIYIQGGTVDQAMEAGRLEELAEPLKLIRSLGCVAGIAGHNPASHRRARELDLGAEFHMVCFYNITGRRGQIDVADSNAHYRPEDRQRAAKLLAQLHRPCGAYKVLAAGRNDPREAIPFAARHLKPTDVIAVGFFPKHRPNEIREDVEILCEALAKQPAVGA